jgi:hypothetical protein
LNDRLSDVLAGDQLDKLDYHTVRHLALQVSFQLEAGECKVGKREGKEAQGTADGYHGIAERPHPAERKVLCKTGGYPIGHKGIVAPHGRSVC